MGVPPRNALGRPPGFGFFAALVLLAEILCPAVPAAPAPEFSAATIMRHVEHLAGEELAGRAAGTAGERRAAEYLARALEQAGIAPHPGGLRLEEFPLPEAGGPVRSQNVIGWIEGADAQLRDEIVILGAHIDHLGMRDGELHAGAEDNASGVAVNLEVAAALQAERAELRRSVAVVFFGAEEVGLRGSRRFVRSGPFDIERIVAMVNVDMIGRPLADQRALAPLKKLFRIDDRNGIGVIGARNQPLLAKIVDAAAAKAGVEVFGTTTIPFLSQVIEGMAKNSSDHAPFERVGIPILFFGSGESDDYHRPSDTIDKLVPELMARRARVVHETVRALANAPREEIPATANARRPDGERVEELALHAGELRAVLRDNSASPGVLSGIQSLFHRDAADFDAYDPDTPGASAGINFEHIISGSRSRSNKFTPRHGRFDLYAHPDGRSATLVRRREDSPWDVASTLRYTVAEPHVVDFEFRATPYSPDLFGARRYAIFFFANYLNDVEAPSIHFRGVEEEGGEETWIEANVPRGHPDWDHGGTYRHLDAEPLEYDDDVEFRLNTWSYDWPRYTTPLYYGRAGRGMVFLLMFDRAHTPLDEIRFSVFTFKLPKHPRPAWDFQYVIHRVEPAREYGFHGRLVWKKWVSREDCLAEYERWLESRPPPRK